MVYTLLKDLADLKKGDQVELEDATVEVYKAGGYIGDTEAKTEDTADIASELKTSIDDMIKASIAEAVKGISAGLGTELDIEVGKTLTVADDPKGGFMSFSHFARDIARAGADGRGSSKALIEWAAKTAGHMEEGDNSQGGYLVPTEFMNTINSHELEAAIVAPRSTFIPMQTNSVSIPYINCTSHATSTHGGVIIYHVDEASQKTASKPTFGKTTLTLHKLVGLVYASDELLEDSPQSIEPIIGKVFGEALAYTKDDRFINGTGVGQALGALAAPCLIAAAKEAGQAADTIIFENVVNMWSRLWPDSHRNAVWMANINAWPQLAAMNMGVGAGGLPVYMPPTGVAGAPFGTLMGRPLILSEKMQALGDEGDILLADWSTYLIGGKSGGVQAATSIHLRFDYDETAFRFVERYDGQPWWPLPLTPRYAGATFTLSPFVTLAERV